MSIESKLEKNKYLVVGLGATGISVTKFLLSKGADVRISDNSKDSDVEKKVKEHDLSGVIVEFGSHSEDMFLWADSIILSPGVPYNMPLIQLAVENGVEVISEIELAYRYISKPIVAITGSNGKTTTTTLIYNILQSSGHKVFLGGNIGTPLIKIADNDNDYDFILLELSSFQLQCINRFKPYISVCLNIYPNHLDHHANLNEYIESKMNIFRNQDSDCWAVVNDSDPYIAEYLDGIKSKILRFGYKTSCDAWTLNSKVFNRGIEYDLAKMRLVGKHNIENVMAAIIVSGIFGCDSSVINDCVLGFDTLPHRIEFVGKYKRANIYNDSKSTTPHATLKALESFDAPVILIAGGKDKGLDYSIFKAEVAKKVKSLIVFGQSGEKIKNIYECCVPVTLVSTLDHAVSKALSYIDDSETILFSPACSSFDMFKSYEERGRIFKEIVKNIQC